MKAIATDIKKLILAMCLLAGFTCSMAQKPVIGEIDKRTGTNGEIVTLKGSFNDQAANTSVTFGAAKGDIKFASENLLEVAVPAGATYDRIVVTDLVSRLSDEGEFPFLYSFGGNHGLTAASFEGQDDTQAESGLYDLCMCDFDGDQRPDIGTASNNSNSVSILSNTTTAPGLSNISFDVQQRLLIAKTISASCGDLNGDGKPELVIAEAGGGLNRIFVLTNNSTPGVFSFSSQQIVIQPRPEITPGITLGNIEIADLDNDGRPEIIVSNQEKNYLKILVNQSTTATVAFATTQLTVEVAGAGSTNDLAITDLNGDGFPEIVTSQFNVNASNIFILKNTSQPGNISFAHEQTLTINQTVVNLRIGDLDGDMKPEIAATQLISNSIAIFRNLSSSNSISFAPFVTFTTAQQPWGIDFGDLDGDGLADIVVSSISKFITVFNNKSTPGSLNFSMQLIPVTYINRHVKVGDVDGDAKPDIVFTSIDNTSVSASKISVIRNKHCLVPVINPAGPLNICSGMELQLNATESNGTNYQWKDGSTTVKSGTDAFYQNSAPSVGTHSYSVIATSEGGACTETSNVVSVTVGTGGLISGEAVAENDGPVCRDNPLTLSVTGVSATPPATLEYQWTGPGGFTATGSNPTIASFQPESAGRYYVDVIVGGCVAQQASTVAEIVSTPPFEVTYSGADVICAPETKTLEVYPNDPDFTYEWAERSTGNTGATGPSFTVNSAGEYYVKATSVDHPGCTAIESTPATIRLAAPPVANFTAPAIACTNQIIDFTNNSTGDPSLTLHYEWDFGNGSQNSTLENPTYQYSTANTYTVMLRTTYDGGACASEIRKDIDIKTAPNVSITTPGGAFELCVGGTLELGVNGSFAAYQWSTGATTPSIEINLPGDYSVNVKSEGCMLSAVVTVDPLPGPEVAATADPAQVNEGQSTQLVATGLATFLWEPAASLNDPTIPNPVATPTGTTVYTVTGADINGCPGLATVEVSVKGDLIINKLGPSKFISPDNGDMINNYWVVEKILDYPQCSVNIFDEKGIKVYDAKPYNNDWDGTFNGKPLPDGVYYYVIRCDGEESTPKVGSITVLR